MSLSFGNAKTVFLNLRSSSLARTEGMILMLEEDEELGVLWFDYCTEKVRFMRCKDEKYH